MLQNLISALSAPTWSSFWDIPHERTKPRPVHIAFADHNLQSSVPICTDSSSCIDLDTSQSTPTGACSGSHRHVPGPFRVLLQICSSNAMCPASKSEQLCAQGTLLALQCWQRCPQQPRLEQPDTVALHAAAMRSVHVFHVGMLSFSRRKGCRIG